MAQPKRKYLYLSLYKKIGTGVQRLYICFQDPATKWAIKNAVRRNRYMKDSYRREVATRRWPMAVL